MVAIYNDVIAVVMDTLIAPTRGAAAGHLPSQKRVQALLASDPLFGKLAHQVLADRLQALGSKQERPPGWAGAISGHDPVTDGPAPRGRSGRAGALQCVSERLLGQIWVNPSSVATVLCAWSRETNASSSPGSARPGSASDATARCHASIARIPCSRTSRSAVSST